VLFILIKMFWAGKGKQGTVPLPPGARIDKRLTRYYS